MWPDRRTLRLAFLPMPRPVFRKLKRLAWCCLAGSTFLLTHAAALAQSHPDMGKLLATAGVTQIEGAGGGGLTPWALIAGYGTRDSYGANVHATVLQTQDYQVKSIGVTAGFADRLELSLSRQILSGSLAPLNDLTIRHDTVGMKLKLTGDAVYDQDRWMPQIAAGIMAKRNRGISGLGPVTSVRQLGARDDSGVDYYLSATKIFLDHRLLLNTTLRATRANQFGLLGFGGEGRNQYEWMPEMSAAFLLTRHLVVGAEYRKKPQNLPALDREKDAWDVFLAYFPSKHWSATLAYVHLGDITVFNPRQQEGVYLSLQAGF